MIGYSFHHDRKLGCMGLETIHRFDWDSSAKDVTVRYHLTTPENETGVPSRIRQTFLQRFNSCFATNNSNYLRCRVLNSPPLIEILEHCSGYPEFVTLELLENSAVVIDFVRHRMDVFYTAAYEPFLLETRIDPSAYSPFLHDFDALMIHSSCVSFGGRAAVFLAADEGGKTTAAGLCRGGVVLSDDQNLFRKQGDGSWLAWGTPWTTFEPNTGSAVPGGFFLLEKADEFSLRRVEPLELFTFLWNEHYPLRFMVPKVYQTRLFDLYRELASSAPAYILKFPKDHIDQEAILKCLNP